jgi:phosphotransacetylase
VLSHESAHHKGITSNVALNPDILIFPDLVSGNVFYKASVFLGNGQVAGVIVGASVPIILTSRGDSAASKMNSIILGILLR